MEQQMISYQAFDTVDCVLTRPPLYSTHIEFFLRSVTSCPATVGRMVLGGMCRSPGPSWSAFLGCDGIFEGSIVSPGRTTGASAEDIMVAPDVAKSMPRGDEIDVHDDGGTIPQKFNCLPVTLVLIAIGERYVPTMEVQVTGGARLEQGTRQNFLVAKKIRSDSQLKNPTPPSTTVLSTQPCVSFRLEPQRRLC